MNILKNNKCRISVFAGHYGSGKTEIAVNYALYLKQSGEEDVTLVDLDVTNPFNRSTDTKDTLKQNGIKLISPNFANTNVDLPSLPASVMSAFTGSGKYIFDLGGNDTGATPFGSYRNKIDESDTVIFMVVNTYRPFSDTVEKISEHIRDIQNRIRLNVNYIISNPNLAGESSIETLLTGHEIIKKAAEMTEIPIAAITGSRAILDMLPEEYSKITFAIDRYMTPKW